MTTATLPRVVLADDLSGAVEIAGVATRFGLSSQVRTEPAIESNADVVCLDMHTRSGSAERAAIVAKQWAKAVHSAGATRLFHKTDSLLRGHVAREIEGILAATVRTSCLLCPANPSRGRTIGGGRYYVNGVPLDQTVFAHDPAHPRMSAVVRQLLGNSTAAIEIPDLESSIDVLQVVKQLSPATLPSGGADFFAAWLAGERLQEQPPQTVALSTPRLIVCGSLAAWQSDRPAQAARYGVPVLTLENASSISAKLVEQGVALLAIGPATGESLALEQRLADEVARILQKSPPAWLLLEGGATARAVIDRLGWQSFQALGELAPGIVALSVAGQSAPQLVIKPGSYLWPDDVWTRDSFNRKP